MKINFKQPRYVLPLIVLPFLILFFYIYRSSIKEEDKKMVEGKDRLQENIADVSSDVKNRSLQDKLNALREKYREGTGSTVIGQISEEDSREPDMDYLVQQENAPSHFLDSIKRELKRGGTPLNEKKVFNEADQDKALEKALSQLSQPEKPRDEDKPVDQMAIFREQMAIVDSMQKANDPEYQKSRQQHIALQQQQLSVDEPEPVPVSKHRVSEEQFNTIMPEQMDVPIQAIIDEALTGYADSRVRIRLLDDIWIGKYLVSKGTYLYALITGFSGQRVLLTIKSFMVGHKALPIKLEIYDNDGLPGLYVPASAFRDFSRELGGNTVQGVTLQQQAENNSQLVMSVLQRMFQSTTSAVTKQIRKNKAKIKYNTLVFLIDPQQLNDTKDY